MAEENSINVLMLGAKRTGKTTLLASLVESIVSGPFKNYITAKDVTEYADGEMTLKEQLDEIRSFSDQVPGTEVSPDTGRTNTFRDYKISVSIPNARGNAIIHFADGNGEFMQQNSNKENRTKLKEKVAAYDLILVAIDTPFLMEADNKDNRLCHESTNKIYNQIPALQTILTEVDDGEGKIAKQIIFVPIKCEKWLQEDKFRYVIDRVKTAYDVILCNLSHYSNIEIGILPVQTVGNLVFSSHRYGYVLSYGKINHRCSYIDRDGGDLILSDGRVIRDLNGACLNMDSKMQFGPITIPYSWFRITKSGYSPRNCDMLAYHILRFALAKTLSAKRKEEKEKSKWTFKRIKRIIVTTAFVLTVGGIAGLMALWAYSSLKKRFGSLSMEKLQKALNDIKNHQSEYFAEDEMYVYKENKLI